MRSKHPIAILLASALLALGGCEVAHVQENLTTRYSAGDPASEMDFWHGLAEKHLASNDEAAQAILLFAEDKSPVSTYDDRIKQLKELGFYPGGFDKPADEAVQRGVVAYALCKILKIRGGLTMAVTGVSERYAVRELVDMDLFPPSSPGQTFSGTELVGIIGKAEDYQKGAGEKPIGSTADHAEQEK